MSATAQSETGALLQVVLRHPRQAFAGEERIASQWQDLNYHSAPQLSRAIDEFERFAERIESVGAEVILAQPGDDDTLDAIYVRDAALVTDGGAILCAMGKNARSTSRL